MALTLNLDIHINAEDPDNPDAEHLALELATEEGQEMANTLRRRLEENGITVKEISVKRGD